MESKTIAKSRCKTNGTLNTIENGVLDFHTGTVNSSSHSTACSLSGPQSKLHYKSNGEIDKSKSNTGGRATGVDITEEKENGLNGNNKDKDMITDELVRQKAFKWCQDSLGGAWTKVTCKDDLIITPVSGGMSNYLYLISLPPSHRVSNSEPSEVLLRIYGEISKSTLDFLIHNSVVFVLLGEKDLGPKPYGMYHDGRIEEFIKADPLQPIDLCRPEIISLVSRKLAYFHSLSMPLCKKPSWFKNLVKGWMDEAQANKAALSRPLTAISDLYPSFDPVKEFELLIKMASNLNAPVVFCHNDLQAGNLLYKAPTDSQPESMTIIDWEYAHYYYRGEDMANHFNEWTYDYSSTGLPGYQWLPERFPSKEQQYSFFTSYLEACGKGDVRKEELDQLYKETNHFVLQSHFFWAFWSLVQALSSGIEFDYMEYAVCRFEGYFKHKAWLEETFGPLE